MMQPGQRLYPDFSSRAKGWETRPARYFLKERSLSVGKDWDKTQLLSLTKQGVIDRDIDSGVGKYPASFEGYQLVEPGDLVFCLFDVEETPRTIGLVKNRGMITSAYTAYQVKANLAEPRFLEYLFVSVDNDKRYRPFYSGLRKTIPKGVLLSTLLSLPSIEEQKAIADFLDRELAQIDLLIQKQKLLKQLSSERRQATISKLVTHGQSANNSHWRLCRLKDVAHIFASNVDKKTYEDGVQVRLCNYVDVYYNDRIVNHLPFMEATASLQEINRFQLKGGWVIATKDSESASDIGIAAYVEKDLPGVVCGYHLAILEPLNDLNGLFLKYFLDCSETKNQLAQRATGLTRVGLGKNDFGTLRIQLPPLVEQVAIAKEITAECERIDRLGAQTDELIAKLQERRRALINSAATGKIDVWGKN